MIQVRAKNLQNASLGYFSAFGSVRNKSVLLGGPPTLHLSFVSSDGMVNGDQPGRSCSPPHARGQSDWCTLATAFGPCDQQETCSGFASPLCALCKDPELHVFPNIPYFFNISAVPALDRVSSIARVEMTRSVHATILDEFTKVIPGLRKEMKS